MIGKLIANIALGPIIELAKLFITERSKKDKLDAKRRELALNLDASFRELKIGYWMGRLPLFIAEVAASGYFALVLLHSVKYFNDIEPLTPLALPLWFQDHFWLALVSIFGLAIVERRIKRK